MDMTPHSKFVLPVPATCNTHNSRYTRCMTPNNEEELKCEWCGDTFERPSEKGPKPKYCSNGHRQAAHRARQESSLFDEAILNIDTSMFENLIPDIELPTIYANIFENLIPDIELPTIDTSIFEDIISKIDVPLLDTTAFKNLVPDFDRTAFEAILSQIDGPLIDASIFENLIPDIELPPIDTSIFEDIISKIDVPVLDTTAFKNLLNGPLIDASIFENLSPNIELPPSDTSIFEDIISNIPRSELEELIASFSPADIESLLPFAESVAAKKTGFLGNEVELVAVLLLVAAWLVAFRAELAEVVEQLLQTFWTMWTLQWQLKNSSPQGDLAVSLAHTIAMFLLGKAARPGSNRSESNPDT